MSSIMSHAYRLTQVRIKKLSIFFMASVIIFTAGALLVFFYFTVNKNFHAENEKIKSDYINLQKDLIKTRVQATYHFIQAIRQTNSDKNEDQIKDIVIDALSNVRFGNMYIFIDTFNGDSVLMNGKKPDVLTNVWNLTDVHGKKIIQEEIKVAKESPDGGYIEYVWHEASVNKDMEYLSFCRNIDDWEWNIGTGVYIGEINNEIQKRTADFKNKLINDLILIAIILFFIVCISMSIAFLINRKMNFLLEEMNSKIDKYYNELEDINKNLESKVEEEYKKRVDQEALLLQQSKMAVIGEMLDCVAHQWKQPLTSLSVCIGNVYCSSALGDLTHDEMESFQRESNEQIKFMSQTMDELREFFRQTKDIEKFNIVSSIESSISLIAAQLKNNFITIQVEMPDSILVNGRANEIKNVILNIINNAKDQIKLKKIQNGLVKIELFAENSTAVINISDNAGGILDELLPDKLFDHRVSSKGNDGSGIGLWLAKLIIERHKGSLRAYNQNSGAVFEIRLPIA